MGQKRIKVFGEIKGKAKKEEEKKEEVKEKVKEVKKEKPKKGKIKPAKVKVRSANYKKKEVLIDKEIKCPLKEAVELAKKTSYTKFDASIDVHINLGVDVAKSSQNVRGKILFPNPIGKKKKIIVFTQQPEKIKKKDVVAGADDLISQVAAGKIDFDIALAIPEIMPKLAKLGKILGPKGLMPNPKSGTITDQPEKVIDQIWAGRTEFKSDNQGIIHQSIGKASWEDKKLIENFNTLLEAVIRAKPAGVKKDYLKSITICSTMGPGIKVALEE